MDVKMLLLIVGLVICGATTVFGVPLDPALIETDPITKPPTTLPTNAQPTTHLPNVTEASTLLPTNSEASTLIPTNSEVSASTLMPTNSEASSLMPTNSEASSLLPTNSEAFTFLSTESSTLLPTTDSSTLLPTTDSSTLLPTTDSSTFLPTTEASSLLPKSDLALLPKTDPTVLLTNQGISTVLPNITEPPTLSAETASSESIQGKKQVAKSERVAGEAVTVRTTPPKPELVADYRRTVIFIWKATYFGEQLFLRGGVNDTAIPIQHRPLDIRGSTAQRDNWAKGDNFLDWEDQPEPYQTAREEGEEAKGTPAQWTTNNAYDSFFHPLNTYGNHYWIVDVMMDCSVTENGFFEFKGISQDRTWESGRVLAYQCQGMETLPWTSINHFALCGKINVFYWGTGLGCRVKDFS